MRKIKGREFYQLFTILVLILLLLTITSIIIIYDAVFKEKKFLLQEMCKNQKEIIQSIYKESKDANTVLNILYNERDITMGIGTTGEYTIGYLKNDSIYFLLRMRQKVEENYTPVSLKSDIAIPLKYALSKNTGFIQGKDYKGTLVLAYCTYIPELKWGLVTKMDVSEVRIPFYRAGLYALISAIFLLYIATLIFRRVSLPLAKKIKESEENYRRLFEYSAIPIWKEDYSEIKKYFDNLRNSGITDFRAYFEEHKENVNHLASLIKVVEINQKSLELFNADSNEDIIKNMLFYFNESSLAVFREEMVILAEGGRFFTAEMPIRILSGEVKIIDMHLSVVKGYEDTLSNVLVSFIDITQRKEYEKSLKLSRKEWMETFDLIPDMITILDKQHRIVRANKAASNRLDTSLHNLLGTFCYQCVHGKPGAPSFCPHDKMLQDGMEHVADFYEENLNMYLQVSVTPIFDQKGEITGSVHIARDITLRKKFENELKEKNNQLEAINATKDKFFNIIAHDMKNPFISLMGASELLYENAGKYDSDRIVTLTKVLNDSAKSGYDMLLNLLDWARSQAGSIIFQPENINLKELIDKNLSTSLEYASGKKIKLNFDIPADMNVYADKNMLESILRNLINNALKFTSAKGDVMVSTKKEKGKVVIFVRDTGVGIEKNDFDKLFRTDIKFSQPGTEHEGGTGLGLLLCKEFVEKHGGKIWVESESGKGSTFFFSLSNDQRI